MLSTWHRSIAVVLVVLALTAAACGDSSSSNSSSSGSKSTTSTTSATHALCSAKDSFAASVRALGDVNLVQNGTSQLQAALDKVKTDGTALADAAGSKFSPQVKAFKSSLSDLDQAVEQRSSNGMQPIANAARSVQSSATALIDSVTSTDCPSSSSTSTTM